MLPSTPINIDRLEHELLQHPDHSFVSFLLSGLRKGFHVEIQEIPDQSLQGDNLRSARKSPDVVSELLQEEVNNGFVIGPFDSSPFPIYRVSPLG